MHRICQATLLHQPLHFGDFLGYRCGGRAELVAFSARRTLSVGWDEIGLTGMRQKSATQDSGVCRSLWGSPAFALFILSTQFGDVTTAGFFHWDWVLMRGLASRHLRRYDIGARKGSFTSYTVLCCITLRVLGFRFQLSH